MSGAATYGNYHDKATTVTLVEKTNMRKLNFEAKLHENYQNFLHQLINGHPQHEHFHRMKSHYFQALQPLSIYYRKNSKG